MGNGTLPRGDNGEVVLGLWNDATGQIVPIHIGATVTGADGKTYALLDVNATVQAAANQRVNAHVGDFVDGAIATLGAEADASASSDSGTFTLMALIKRLLTKLPAIGPQTKAASVSVTFATDNPKAAVTVADGDNTTFGAEADAAAASDTSTATYMSLFKRLLAKFPTIGPQAKASSLSVTFATDNPKAGVTAASGDFADGADATQGAKGDSAATDSTSSWSAIALLKGIIAKLLTSIAVTQSGTWTVQPGNTPNTSAWLVQDVVASANGPVPYHNITAASTNFTNVKGSACQCYGLDLSNTSSSAIYVKLYDKATAPGTGDTPKRTIQVPANGTVIRTFPKGLKFANGFGWAATGAVADNDNTNIAANCVVDFDLNS